MNTLILGLTASSLLENKYVTIALLCALAAAALKAVDQWRQHKRKVAQDFGEGARALGLTELPEAIDEFARYDNEAVWNRLKELGKRLKDPNGFADALCEIYEKTFPNAMKNPYCKQRLQPVVAKEMLGFILDDKTRVDLVHSAQGLHELGSKELHAFFTALTLNDLDAAKKAFQDFVDVLRNPDRLRVLLLERAKVTLPALMKDEAAAKVIKEIVNGPPSIKEQIAALQAKLPAEEAA